MNVQECIAEITARGTDDFVSILEIAGIVEFRIDKKIDIVVKRMSMTVIKEVLHQGLMEVGDLQGEGGCFRKWEMSEREAMEEIDRIWDINKPDSIWGWSCWFQNTAKGNEMGEELITRIQRCRESLVIRGMDGLLHASDIASVAIEVGGATTVGEIRWLSLEMIDLLVQEGHIEIGDFLETDCDPKLDFKPWSLQYDYNIERIEDEWLALGRNPNPGEICCLRITSKGREMAEELKGQKGNEP